MIPALISLTLRPQSPLRSAPRPRPARGLEAWKHVSAITMGPSRSARARYDAPAGRQGCVRARARPRAKPALSAAPISSRHDRGTYRIALEAGAG